MNKDLLIDLMNGLHSEGDSEGYGDGVSDCVNIIRQHTIAPDVVVVANAICDAFCNGKANSDVIKRISLGEVDKNMQACCLRAAKAAIKAMGASIPCASADKTAGFASRKDAVIEASAKLGIPAECMNLNMGDASTRKDEAQTHRIAPSDAMSFAPDQLDDARNIGSPSEIPDTIEKWQQVLDDAIAYRKLKPVMSEEAIEQAAGVVFDSSGYHSSEYEPYEAGFKAGVKHVN